MQMQCMRHRITTEGSTNKGAEELKHGSKNLQQQWPRGVFTVCLTTRCMVANDHSREMRVRYCRSPSHPEKLMAGSHATPTQLLPKQLTGSLNQGYEQDLNTKERSSTCTTKRTIGQQLRVPQLANHRLQKLYKMKEILKRSPTLPRTYKTTVGNDGNCRRKATVNSNLGFEAKNTIEKYFTKHQQTSRCKEPTAEFSNHAKQNNVVEHYLRLVLNQKLDNQTTGLNITGIPPKAVASSRAIPAASYSNHHQLQAIVANKSLTAGQPVATSKRRHANLSKRCCFALNEQKSHRFLIAE
ncbi:hypothetical protein F511_38111 [Dorcoceras hygrometricum]|uniref:Uncharacterized protein n=1 Tax=Dorcoceras hygrometricum TaxID=472368 RepID=A0A2Z7A9N7_9LAMI|nr:hypothetical protein F511_38111 [Dorcoceras hygrometricum]